MGNTNDVIEDIRKLERRSRRSLPVTVVALLLVVGSVIYSIVALSRLQADISAKKLELLTLEQQKSRTVRVLEQLRRATSEQERILRDLQQRGVVPGDLSAKTQQSIASTERASQAAAAVLPVPTVGILIAGEWQRSDAERVAETLRQRGFHIQVVRPLRGNAVASSESSIRHYRSGADLGDAIEIRDLLKNEFGIANVRIETASKIDSPPNKYEIWFGQTAFATQ